MRHRVSRTSPPSIAASGLSADTTHHIYAYWDTATAAVKIEAVTFGGTKDPIFTDGILTKDADKMRRWMGVARTNATPDWEDSKDKRYIANFYVRRPKNISATVNTGGSADTDTIEVVQNSILSNWSINLSYQSRITNTDVTGMPRAALTEDGIAVVNAYGLTLTESGTDIVTQYDMGLSLSWSEAFKGGTTKTVYKVEHSGGTVTIQAGEFLGSVWT